MKIHLNPRTLESLNPIKDFKNIFRNREVSHGTED
jgi:hypothetical protein